MFYLKSYDRLIDLNLNRLFEGLKVIEDLIRFHLKSEKELTLLRRQKKLLYPILENLRYQVLWARDIKSDPGKKTTFDIRTSKNIFEDLFRILKTNFCRTQEASRVLEEIFKNQNLTYHQHFKKLRFFLYDLEKKIFTQLITNFDPRLYVILDIPSIGRKNLSEIVRALVKGGATMIQLRENKDTKAQDWLKDALTIKKALDPFPQVKFIINDRVDIALAINAHGVHLGKEDLSPYLARQLLGETKIIGVTVRNLKEAQRAQRATANYLGVGAIFPSKTKPEVFVVGLKALKKIACQIKIPVIGIGGINRHNIREVIKARASGVAVISAVFSDVDFSNKNFAKQIIKNLKALKTALK
jgi:thiamine-phosphate pyrophosphorylase